MGGFSVIVLMNILLFLYIFFITIFVAIILTLLGIIFGLSFGSYLCHYIISTCEPDYLLFDRHVFLLSYVFSALITIIFTIIVIIVTHFNLKNINMVESLKNVE